MWVASRVEEGMPVGLREIDDPQPPLQSTRSTRSQAFQLLRLVASRLGLEVVRTRLRVLGRGLQHHVYLGWFGHPESHLELAAIARIPVADPAGGIPDREAVLNRIHFLDALGRLDSGVQIPRTFGAASTRYGWATVQSGLEGMQLDLLKDRSPLRAIAQAAAICHALDPRPLAEWLAPCANRKDFAREQLSVISEVGIPGASRALRWAEAHLPPEVPCRLVHGDLLPQNLLVDLELELSGILDWDFATLGDPAYDLAIATRGSPRPFKVVGGLRKLLEIYNSLVEKPLLPSNVQLYELCIRAHHFADAVRQRGRKSPHAQQLGGEFVSLMRRIGIE